VGPKTYYADKLAFSICSLIAVILIFNTLTVNEVMTSFECMVSLSIAEYGLRAVNIFPHLNIF